MKMIFEDRVNDDRVDDVQLSIDNLYIADLRFDHDNKDIKASVNDDISVEFLEKIYAYQGSFNKFAQMLFMEIGYTYFLKLEKYDPKKAQKLKQQLKNIEKK